jgi:hypothetical protein
MPSAVPRHVRAAAKDLLGIVGSGPAQETPHDVAVVLPHGYPQGANDHEVVAPSASRHGWLVVASREDLKIAAGVENVPTTGARLVTARPATPQSDETPTNRLRYVFRAERLKDAILRLLP